MRMQLSEVCDQVVVYCAIYDTRYHT